MTKLAASEGIGVVIPAFGHPRFLAEAIISACEQVADCPVHVVVVDDGCRFDETRQVVHALSAHYGGKLFYCRQQNARLSAARNKGVKFLLHRFPKLEAVFFLDADNRLSEGSLARFRAVLGDDPQIGWAYPDIGFFGLTANLSGVDIRETAPDYSILKHLVGNISEAGSMVRADIFRENVFFNEALRTGYEDWDFWLSCLEAGYRGLRVQDSGFLYRRRPESMLADARREGDSLTQRLRMGHKTLFTPRYVLEIMQKEAPPFAVILSDKDAVYLFLDPQASPELLTKAEWQERIAYRLAVPARAFFPERIITTSEAVWQALKAYRPALRSLFMLLWLEKAPASFWQIGFRTKSLEKNAQILMMDGRIYLTKVKNQAKHFSFSPPGRFFAHPIFEADLPALDLPALDLNILEQALWQSMPGPEALLVAFPEHRRFSGPDADETLDILYTDIFGLNEGGRPFPSLAGSRSFLLLVPTSLTGMSHSEGEGAPSFALVDQFVERFQAGVQTAQSALFLEYSREADFKPLPALWKKTCTDIMIGVVGGENYGNGRYLGRSLLTDLSVFTRFTLGKYMESQKMTIALADAAGLDALGAGRQSGGETLVMAPRAHIRQSDREQKEGQIGRLLAFEHAAGHIATDTPDFAVSLSAAGVPASKIISLEKAWARIDQVRDRVNAPKGESALATIVGPVELPAGWRPREAYVFLITYGRSGSTILQRVLQNMEGMCFRGENLNLLEAFADIRHRLMQIKHFADMDEAIKPERPWYGADKIKTGQFLEDLAALFVRHVLRPTPDARLVGFKEIRYVGMETSDFFEILDFMRTGLAPAKFIFNRRSLKTLIHSSWWARMSEEKVRALIEAADQNFANYAARYPEICLMMDFEDFCDNPDGLRPLFDFLNRPYDRDKVENLMKERLGH